MPSRFRNNRKPKRRRKHPPLDELLAARPVRNHSIEVLSDAPDRLVVSLPVKTYWWNTGLMRWIIPTRRYKQYELDRRGRHFLELADGRKCSSDISVATYTQPPSWPYMEGIGVPFGQDITVEIWFVP